MAFEQELKFLDPKAANVIGNEPNPQTGDHELRLFWACSKDDLRESAVRFLKTYGWATNHPTAQTYVENPVIDGKTYTGRYRVAGISQLITGREDKPDGIILTLRRGYMTTVDWTEARIAGDHRIASNGSQVTGIDDTTSNNPIRHMLVQFHNVSPLHKKAIADSLAAGSTITSPVIQGETYSGAWHVAYVRPVPSEGGEYVLQVMLGRPQYTLIEYTDKGGDRESYRARLVGVPRTLAQQIIDDWGDQSGVVGQSASSSVGVEESYVDITLTKPAGIPLNMTLNNVPTACDTTTTLHVAWGYTEAAAGDFITNHSGALGANQTRNIRKFDTRGDGLFDIIIEEITLTYDAAKHLLSINLIVGTKITDARQWGYNVPVTLLADIKTAYETATLGWAADFEITRKDGCSFDFKGNIRKRTDDTKTATTGGVGEEAALEVHTAVDPVAMADVVSTVDGVSYQDEPKPMEDGKWAWLRKKITRKAISAAVTAASTYLTRTLTSGWVTKTAAATLDEAAAVGKTVDVQITQEQDGLLKFLKDKKIRTARTVTLTGGSIGSADSLLVGLIAAADVATLAIALPQGTTLELTNAASDEDGMVPFTLRKAVKAKVGKDGIKTGQYLFPETRAKQENAKLGTELPSAIDAAPTRGTGRQFILAPKEDGTAGYELVEVSGVAHEETFVSRNDGLIKETTTIGRNATTAGTLGTDKGEASNQITDLALLDYAKKTLAMTDGAPTLTIVSASEAEVEYDRQYKWFTIPYYSTTILAQGNFAKALLGNKVYCYYTEITRQLSQTTTRVYSLTPPSATEFTTGNASSQVTYIPSHSLWMKETTTITKGAYTLAASGLLGGGAFLVVPAAG